MKTQLITTNPYYAQNNKYPTKFGSSVASAEKLADASSDVAAKITEKLTDNFMRTTPGNGQAEALGNLVEFAGRPTKELIEYYKLKFNIS